MNKLKLEAKRFLVVSRLFKLVVKGVFLSSLSKVAGLNGMSALSSCLWLLRILDHHHELVEVENLSRGGMLFDPEDAQSPTHDPS